MIQSVRSYFETTIKEIDSDFRSDDLVFNTALTADHNLDFTYKLNIGTMRVSRQDTSMEAVVPVRVSIFRVSNIDKQKVDFDNTYCKAIDILARAMNQSRVDQAEYIKAVEGFNIEPSPISDNDNTMRFDIDFNVTLSFIYTLN